MTPGILHYIHIVLSLYYGKTVDHLRTTKMYALFRDMQNVQIYTDDILRDIYET